MAASRNLVEEKEEQKCNRHSGTKEHFREYYQNFSRVASDRVRGHVNNLHVVYPGNQRIYSWANIDNLSK